MSHICLKAYLPGYSMNSHLKLHDPPEFLCYFEGCRKVFKTKCVLNQHLIMKHTADKNLKCSECSHKSRNKILLSIRFSKKDRDWKWKCKVAGCNFIATQKILIVLHYKFLIAYQALSQQKKVELLDAIEKGKVAYSEFPIFSLQEFSSITGVK